ncbi:VacJ family lipoprotein, partial [Phaeospirillum tilakii]
MRLTSLLAAAVVCMAAGCATLPEDPEERAEIEALNDPLEPTNRAIFDVNMALDDAVMVPVAESYRDNLPDWLREGIHNILSNLQEPYVAGNDLLQGNTRAAADSLGRFLINSTFGLFGARDAVADSGGAKPHKTDIGITLGVWGFEDGPYLMLPFLGPSSLRDGTGKVAEYWASPTGAMLEAGGVGVISDVQTGVDLLDTRAALLDPMNELRRTSLDEYAAIRSLYRQSRAAALAEARAGQLASRAPVAGAPAAAPA